MQIGQVFFLWEMATATAGAVIGINPFDQPDVEASKIETRKLTDAYTQSGKLPDETPFLIKDGIKLFTGRARPGRPAPGNAGRRHQGAPGPRRPRRLRGAAGLH